MRLIKARKKIDTEIFISALILAILPAVGLLSGEAISLGTFGENYQEWSSDTNPADYWYIIKLQLTVVFLFLIKAKYCFPLFDAFYQKLLLFKYNHTFIAYLCLYIVVPISVVALCLLLLWYF